MADWTIKQHDTWPPIHVILKDATGTPIDLTSASVVSIYAATATGTNPWNGTCSIVSAAAGHVSYQFTGVTDTATVNTYNAEFQITWSDSTITTVPTAGYISISVVKDLGP